MDPTPRPPSPEALQRRRQALLLEMGRMRCMRPGSLCAQYQPVVRHGRPTPERRGPYYVLTTKQRGKTVSRRLPSPEEVARVREEVDNYQRYVALSREFVALTQQLGEMDRARDAALEQEKKRRRSRWRATRRSSGF
jgi:hypothetical protein